MAVIHWKNKIKIVLMTLFEFCLYLVRDLFAFIAIKCGFRLEYLLKVGKLVKLTQRSQFLPKMQDLTKKLVRGY